MKYINLDDLASMGITYDASISVEQVEDSCVKAVVTLAFRVFSEEEIQKITQEVARLASEELTRRS